MDRMACVDLPEFPLQLLLRRQPAWAGRPAVVVDQDKPQGVILWANQAARKVRVLPGLRYSQGLSLCRELCAGVVSTDDLERSIDGLVRCLQGYSPSVEASAEEPGVFWIDASGLVRLYGSLEAWGGEVRQGLKQEGFESAVAIGFRRPATYAAAKARCRLRLGPVIVFRDEAHEQTVLDRAPLEALGMVPALRVRLAQLDIHTVGAFLALPAAMVRKRLGKEAWQLHSSFSGMREKPLEPRAPFIPLVRGTHLDEAERDVNRLLLVIEQDLEALLEMLAARYENLAELEVRLTYESRWVGVSTSRPLPPGAAPRRPHGNRAEACAAPLPGATAPRRPQGNRAEALAALPPDATQAASVPEQTERIRPAAPTLDMSQLINLVRLRLEARPFPAGVVGVSLQARGVRLARGQLQLFRARQQRDLRVGERALARVRAEFGDEAVQCARLKDAHLPEAGFRWENLEALLIPSPRAVSCRRMIRRILANAECLAPRGRREPDGWLLKGSGHGHVVRMQGPYIVSGGWWVTPEQREYHYAETRDGSIFWVFYDRIRRAWFLQGTVE